MEKNYNHTYIAKKFMGRGKIPRPGFWYDKCNNSGMRECQRRKKHFPCHPPI
jgi:hypothetical protein